MRASRRCFSSRREFHCVRVGLLIGGFVIVRTAGRDHAAVHTDHTSRQHLPLLLCTLWRCTLQGVGGFYVMSLHIDLEYLLATDITDFLSPGTKPAIS